MYPGQSNATLHPKLCQGQLCQKRKSLLLSKQFEMQVSLLWKKETKDVDGSQADIPPIVVSATSFLRELVELELLSKIYRQTSRIPVKCSTGLFLVPASFRNPILDLQEWYTAWQISHLNY